MGGELREKAARCSWLRRSQLEPCTGHIARDRGSSPTTHLIPHCPGRADWLGWRAFQKGRRLGGRRRQGWWASNKGGFPQGAVPLSPLLSRLSSQLSLPASPKATWHSGTCAQPGQTVSSPRGHRQPPAPRRPAQGLSQTVQGHGSATDSLSA